jgi:hypothetical protein
MAEVLLDAPLDALPSQISRAQKHAHHDEREVIDATNRGIDDLDLSLWLAFTSCACFTRILSQYPFLLAMTRRQAAAELETASSASLLKQMYRTHGTARSFFRGFPAMVSGMVMSEVAYLWIFEWLRNKHGASPLAYAAGGDSACQAVLDGGAGFTADVVTTVCQVPFFVVSNRQMCAGMGVAATLPYENSFRTLRRVVQSGSGAAGMFAGLTPSLLLSTHSAFWWSAYGGMKCQFYDTCRPTLERVQRQHPWIPSPLVSPTDNIPLNTLAAVIAGTVVAVVWNPLYVLRTRMQVDAVGENLTNPPTLRAAARKIWRTEGWRGFTRGTCMSVTSTVVDCTVFSCMYELGKQLAQKF